MRKKNTAILAALNPKLTTQETTGLLKANGPCISEALKKEYMSAQKDPDRKKTIEEWKILDAEGWE